MNTVCRLRIVKNRVYIHFKRAYRPYSSRFEELCSPQFDLYIHFIKSHFAQLIPTYYSTLRHTTEHILKRALEHILKRALFITIRTLHTLQKVTFCTIWSLRILQRAHLSRFRKSCGYRVKPLTSKPSTENPTRPTQSIIDVPLLLNRVRKSVLLFVQSIVISETTQNPCKTTTL